MTYSQSVASQSGFVDTEVGTRRMVEKNVPADSNSSVDETTRNLETIVRKVGEVQQYLDSGVDNEVHRENPLDDGGHAENEGEEVTGNERLCVKEASRQRKDGEKNAEPARSDNTAVAREEVDRDVVMLQRLDEIDDSPLGGALDDEEDAASSNKDVAKNRERVEDQPGSARISSKTQNKVAVVIQAVQRRKSTLALKRNLLKARKMTRLQHRPQPAEQPIAPHQPVRHSAAPQPQVEKRKRREVDYSEMQGQVKRLKYRKDDAGDNVVEQSHRWVKLEEGICVSFSFL